MRIGSREIRLPAVFDLTGVPAALRRTLVLFLWGMALGTAFAGISTGAPFTGMVKHIGISDLGCAVLVALPFLGSIAQLLASSVMEKRRNRRALMLGYGIAARALWLLVGLVPILVPGEYNLRLWALLLLCSASAFCAAFLNVSFLSLLADVVPINVRGRYLAARYKAGLVAGFLVSFAVGWLLDMLPSTTGYAVVFALAAVLGVLDIVLYFFIKWPPMERQDEKAGFGTFLRGALRDKRFVLVCAFWTLFYFACRISNPFWPIYMLGTLDMSYRQLSLMVTMVFNVCSILAISRWGRSIDQRGIYATAVISCAIIVIVPLPYLIATPSMLWPVMLGEALSGLGWSGSDLVAMNMYLAASPQEGRSVYIACYMLFTQLLGNALAFVAGGWMVDNVFPVLESITATIVPVTRHTGIFVLSLALRLAVVLLFLPRLRQKDDPPMRIILTGRAPRWQDGGLLPAKTRRRLAKSGE